MKLLWLANRVKISVITNFVSGSGFKVYLAIEYLFCSTIKFIDFWLVTTSNRPKLVITTLTRFEPVTNRILVVILISVSRRLVLVTFHNIAEHACMLSRLIKFL